MPSAKRTQTFPIIRRSWISERFFSFLYRKFGYVPSFVGKCVRKGNYYDFYLNNKSNRFYLLDKKTGSITRMEK